MRLPAALLVLIAFALPARAQEEVVLGLSKDQVRISTDFSGSEILIYGAVKRTSPIIEDPPLEVIITVAGPSRPLTVRRKDRRFGIWVNTTFAEIDAAPTFYAVATSAPWPDVITETEDLRHRISIPRAIRAVGSGVDEPGIFTDALIRVRENEGVYQINESSVDLTESTLFETSIDMPANLTEGAYATRIYLTRAGGVVAEYDTTIEVRKVGLERWLFTLSRQQPLIYGLLSLAIAIAAGWGASAGFRILRNQ